MGQKKNRLVGPVSKLSFCDVREGRDDSWFLSFEQRLNGECIYSSCSQIQSCWLFWIDGWRTVVFRRYVTSRVCRFLHPLHWFKLVNLLSSASSGVSMTVFVVLSMLSLPSAHCALSFVAQFVVIRLITCQAEGLVRS